MGLLVKSKEISPQGSQARFSDCYYPIWREGRQEQQRCLACHFQISQQKRPSEGPEKTFQDKIGGAHYKVLIKYNFNY